jgi:hypothetical protein
MCNPARAVFLGIKNAFLMVLIQHPLMAEGFIHRTIKLHGSLLRLDRPLYMEDVPYKNGIVAMEYIPYIFIIG